MPIHPFFAHLPIYLIYGLLSVELFIFATKDKHRSALVIRNFLLLTILPSLIVVYATGTYASYDNISNELDVTESINRHRNLGIISLILSIPLLAFAFIKNNSSRIIYFFILLSITTFISLTGFYGGDMVYNKGIGVNLNDKK